MIVNFGQIIKVNRINKKITQSALSNGICSITHLSKIENGSREANNEVINLLLKRLNMNIDEIKSKAQRHLFELDYFIKSVHFYHRNKARDYYNQIVNNAEDYLYTGLIFEYFISIFHYYILINDNDRLKETYLNIKKISKTLSGSNIPKFMYVKGLYLLRIGDYKNSLNLLNRYRKINKTNEPELLYYLALVNGEMNNNVTALNFAYKSLEMFKSESNYIRTIHAELLLTILLTELRSYEEAESYYKEILLQVSIIDDSALTACVNHNYGELLKKMGKCEEALEKLSKSLAYHKKENIMVNYLMDLVEVAGIKLENKSPDTLKIIEEIIKLSKEQNNKYIFIKFSVNKYHLENNYKILSEYIKNNAIPYMRNKGYKNDLIGLYKILLTDMKNYINEADFNRLIKELLSVI